MLLFLRQKKVGNHHLQGNVQVYNVRIPAQWGWKGRDAWKTEIHPRRLRHQSCAAGLGSMGVAQNSTAGGKPQGLVFVSLQKAPKWVPLFGATALSPFRKGSFRKASWNGLGPPGGGQAFGQEQLFQGSAAHLENRAAARKRRRILNAKDGGFGRRVCFFNPQPTGQAGLGEFVLVFRVVWALCWLQGVVWRRNSGSCSSASSCDAVRELVRVLVNFSHSHWGSLV